MLKQKSYSLKFNGLQINERKSDFQGRRALLMCIMSAALLVSGCARNSYPIDQQVKAGDQREVTKLSKIEHLPLRRAAAYPVKKVEIAPAEFTAKFSSIYIFHTGTNLHTSNMGITPEKIFAPTLKMLAAKGYKAELG